MTVAVVGGAGFIGSNLVDALVARGDDVLVVDNLSTGYRSITLVRRGLVPVQIAVICHFGLLSAEVSSWMFIIWMSGSLASIPLSLIFRQPIPITSSIPALLFLGTLADRFYFPELLGANFMAGILMMVLGASSVGSRLLKWRPLPSALGMLAGSIFGDVSNVVQLTVADGFVPP